jgi:hypothetical protein
MHKQRTSATAHERSECVSALDRFCLPANHGTVFGVDTLAGADKSIAFENALRRNVLNSGFCGNPSHTRVASPPLKQLFYRPSGASTPLARRRNAVPDRDLSIAGHPNDGAKSDDLAVLHHHPGRRREFSADFSRKASQHLQYVRRCNRTVWNKAQIARRDTVQQRVKITASEFDEHVLLDIRHAPALGALRPSDRARISPRSRSRAPLSLPPQPVSSGSSRRQTKAFSRKMKMQISAQRGGRKMVGWSKR